MREDIQMLKVPLIASFGVIQNYIPFINNFLSILISIATLIYITYRIVQTHKNIKDKKNGE